MTTPANNWQLISTAPKDGTAILGYFGRTAGDEPPDMSVTLWDDGEWRSADSLRPAYDEPTHWMPLPSPPEVDHG